MFDLKFDIREFKRAALDMNAALDQVPFALSVALNNAIEGTRAEIINVTWPKHVTVRKANFLQAALTTAGERAMKNRLRVVLYDRLGRGSLALHAEGGTKRPLRSKLAIPSKAVMRGSNGVVASQRPANLSRKVVKGNLIFQATGRGKDSKLKLMYKLAQRAQIKRDVPFYDDFNASMAARVQAEFPKAMAKAMATRR